MRKNKVEARQYKREMFRKKITHMSASLDNTKSTTAFDNIWLIQYYACVRWISQCTKLSQQFLLSLI